MYIKPLLEMARPDIIGGLMTGKYRRWGGVVRVAAGQTNGGQIVTMLREASPVLQAVNPVGAALKSVDMVVNAAGHHVTHKLVREGFAQTHKMLGQVMGISAVGAGASVLNLGLTAAGFYVMNKKLNRMQEDVSQLLRMGEKTFQKVGEIDRKIDGVTNRLVELQYYAAVADVELRQILTAVYDVQGTLRSTQKGEMTAALRALASDLALEDTELRQHLHKVHAIRLALENELSGRRLEPGNDPRRFMDTLDAYRLWTVAGMAEVAVERQNNQLDSAAEKAAELAAVGRKWSGQWADDLFPADEYGGVFRFGHSAFEQILPEETRWRTAFAAKGEELSPGKVTQYETEGAAQVARHKPGLNDAWFDRQVRLAHVLDMIEENTERLESMSWETAYCAENLLGPEQWENLEDPQEDDEEVVFDWESVAETVSVKE